MKSNGYGATTTLGMAASKILQLQNQYQGQQLTELQHMERQIMRFRHDVRNHLFVIHDLLESGQYDELQKYLKDIDKHYIGERKRISVTGNSILDAIINIRSMICDKENIKFSCMVKGDFGSAQGFELGIILFSLLDNAIEASIKEQGDREISLTLKSAPDYIDIWIKNRIEVSVLNENENLETTKADKEQHGIGLEHVKDLADQLDGLFDISEKDGYFCAHALIPNLEKSTI